MHNLLSKIEITTNSVAMEILDLLGNPLTEDELSKPKIKFFGIDSENFKNALKEVTEEDTESGKKLVAKCVDSWENIKTDEGLPIECNFENALTLFKKYPVVFGQADKFIASRANYLKK